MTSFWTTTSRDEGDVPKVIKVPLVEGKSTDWHPCFDLSAIGRQAYEASWFADFRERWQRALRDERWNYRARLEAACTASK